jgi:hypothetical protein
MITKRYLIIATGVFLFFLSQAHADSLDTFLSNYTSLLQEERVGWLEKAIETASEETREVFHLLLIDAKYEVARRQIASQMLALAESRAASLPVEHLDKFSAQVGNYDTLAMLQSIPLAWLTKLERERALSLSLEIENQLHSIGTTGDADANVRAPVSDSLPSIDDAIAMVNEALEKAGQENLLLLSEATPNGSIRSSLHRCEAARETLMAQAPDVTHSSRARWEAAMLHLSKAVAALKQRQTLKYSLWAEGRYRESASDKLSRQLSNQEAMVLYKRLSEINVSIVIEPSLAREITKRLYELYDCIDSGKAKERVRYEAIINLDKRLSLEDF